MKEQKWTKGNVVRFLTDKYHEVETWPLEKQELIWSLYLEAMVDEVVKGRAAIVEAKERIREMEQQGDDMPMGPEKWKMILKIRRLRDGGLSNREGRQWHRERGIDVIKKHLESIRSAMGQS